MTEQTPDALADLIAAHRLIGGSSYDAYTMTCACDPHGTRYGTANLNAHAAHVAAVVRASGAAGDEYHSMSELYEYRMLYNAHAARGWLATGVPVVKSRRHSDGEPCFGGGWFIVVASLPTGQVSNHYKDEYWSLFDVPEVELPPEYDGHTPQDAATRLAAALTLPGRASGAGMGGTSREQIAEVVDAHRSTVIVRFDAPDDEDATVMVCDGGACSWSGRSTADHAEHVADAVLALRPDPAPDDTTDLRAEDRYAGMDGSDAVRLVAVNHIRELTIELDAARADLARVREEAQLRADVWRDRYARAEAETEAIAGDLAALREGLQATIDRANAEERRYAAEVERLHSWAGLMELLDEHWPADIWPMLEDDTKADAGHRVTSAMRWIDRLTAERDALREGLAAFKENHALDEQVRADLAALREGIERLVSEGTGVECVPTDDLRALLGGQE